MDLLEELCLACCSIRERMAASVGWPLMWAVLLATYAQPVAETQVMKVGRRPEAREDI